jgi:hypothetical protein
LCIPQLVHHAMKSGWNMMQSNLTPFLHSTVFQTWFHNYCTQCALHLVCCGKSHQQPAPQDIVIYWSKEATVNVISKLCKLHNYLLYALSFYQCLTWSLFWTCDCQNLYSISILHLLIICINHISKATSDYTSQKKLRLVTGCISDITNATHNTKTTT